MSTSVRKVRKQMPRKSATAKSARTATAKTVSAKSTSAKTASAKTKTTRKKVVVPDGIDLRDRIYAPSITVIPASELPPRVSIPVLNQKQTSACTGFALASVIFHLQHCAKRSEKVTAVSPFMLYAMARRYDEFPGAPDKDTGSSLRGAMKGWFKHGACASALWKGFAMPAPTKDPQKDWWLDASKRPLGAYFRIDTKSIADMQIALNEIGAIYASAVCHSGWDTYKPGTKVAPGHYWEIPYQKALPDDGGHAFAIVGYNRQGFIIQNSWGPTWAANGCAVLTYQDWLDNAMDCWVAQLGVVTDVHIQIASSPSLHTAANGKVELAADKTLRNRQIAPFVVDMENNGKLSNTGEFFTNVSDLQALVTDHLDEAREKWKLAPKDVVDIAIYAHGGLTSEDGAADTAAKWIRALYDAQIFPIFLMWETDLWSTLKDRVADAVSGQARETGGFWDETKKWWNERLEKLLTVPGSLVWGEMKQNADAISSGDGGAVQLYQTWKDAGLDGSKVRLHLIGHSAGSIVHSHIVDRLKWNFASINFMAPACRRDLFEQCVVPALAKGRVQQLNEFHLSDDFELKDNTCKPILGYGRSLLYLVSQSFEKGEVTPILGMDKYFGDTKGLSGLNNYAVYKSPGQKTKSITHGGFDDDDLTLKSILNCIKAAR